MTAQPISRLRFEASRLAAFLYLAGWAVGLVWAIDAADGLFWDVALCSAFALLAWPVSVKELLQTYTAYVVEQQARRERRLSSTAR